MNIWTKNHTPLYVIFLSLLAKHYYLQSVMKMFLDAAVTFSQYRGTKKQL